MNSALGGAAAHAHGPAARARFRDWIHERQHLAAAEHVLIDGVGGLGR